MILFAYCVMRFQNTLIQRGQVFKQFQFLGVAFLSFRSRRACHTVILGRTTFGSPKSIYISNPKTGIKQIEQFNMSPGLRKKAQDAKDAVLRFLKFSVSFALTRRLRFFIFLRFSVYYAIYKHTLEYVNKFFVNIWYWTVVLLHDVDRCAPLFGTIVHWMMLDGISLDAISVTLRFDHCLCWNLRFQ